MLFSNIVPLFFYVNLTAYADSSQYGNIYYEENEDGTIEITIHWLRRSKQSKKYPRHLIVSGVLLYMIL